MYRDEGIRTVGNDTQVLDVYDLLITELFVRCSSTTTKQRHLSEYPIAGEGLHRREWHIRLGARKLGGGVDQCRCFGNDSTVCSQCTQQRSPSYI